MGQPEGMLGVTAGDRAVDRVEAALYSLLRHFPEAEVAAIAGDSSARVVQVPDQLAIPDSHPRFTGSSLVAVVSPADRPVVSKTWSRARAVGHARGELRLKGDPPISGNLHMFDLRHLYGVIVVAFAEDDVELPELLELDRATPTPRLARMIKDPSATIVEVDRAVHTLLGWSPQEIIGRRSLELIHPDDQDRAIDAWMRMLDVPGSSRGIQLRHRHRDGYWVWLEVHNYNRLTDPEHGDVVAEMVDISEEVAAQDAVRARQQLLEQLTETLPIGLFHADLDGNLLYANQRLTEITGLPVGSRLGDWPGITSGRSVAVIDRALAAAAGGDPTNTVVDVVDPGGDSRHCSLSIRPLSNPSGGVTGMTGAVEDVTTAVVERRELEVRAATDGLTGCLNRPAIMARLQDALDEMGPDGRPDGVVVIFVDVDGLKEINDRLGHLAGDALLTEVAKRLSNAVRSRDAVGRYGGDEFVVLASHVRSAEHARTVARWIAARVLRTVLIEGEPVEIRASLGVAWTASYGVEADALIRQADAAMYRSKREGNCEPVLTTVTP